MVCVIHRTKLWPAFYCTLFSYNAYRIYILKTPGTSSFIAEPPPNPALKGTDPHMLMSPRGQTSADPTLCSTPPSLAPLRLFGLFPMSSIAAESCNTAHGNKNALLWSGSAKNVQGIRPCQARCSIDLGEEGEGCMRGVVGTSVF